MQELTLSRGFQSSVAPRMHFGIGLDENLKEVEIIWPDGKVESIPNPQINKEHIVSYAKANPVAVTLIHKEEKKLFVTKKDSISFPNHFYAENFYDDYVEQVLLPHSLSQFGPAMAKGDLNNDGLEDFILGGSHGNTAALFLQNENGFIKTHSIEMDKDNAFEDMGISLFDANNDGWMDIYVASGGNEFEPGDDRYQDRLYINSKDGSFQRVKDAIPTLSHSSGRVFPLDYDKDGDMDILVTSRLIPDNYPDPASSVLLENIGNKNIVKFKDVTSDKAEVLNQIGLVTDAVITDINGDDYPDILLGGEWMPIKVLLNESGKFTDESETYGFNENSLGWWWSMESGDFDGDGDMDLILGNNGLNYKYKASEEETFDIYVKDFDKNAKEDIVLSYYNGGKQFPVRGRECSSQQIPTIKQKFQNYESFSNATLVDVYTEEELDKALHYQIKSFASVYAENRNGKFVFHSLPQEAQISNINQILVDDFDKDGHLDAVIAGNLYQSEVETPRNDAGIGLFLKGNGSGEFEPIPARESGLYIPGDVKEMIELDFQGNPLIIVGKNQDYIQYIKTAI